MFSFLYVENSFVNKSWFWEFDKFLSIRRGFLLVFEGMNDFMCIFYKYMYSIFYILMFLNIK